MDRRLVLPVARAAAVVALLLLARPASAAAYGIAAIALCLVLVPGESLARRAPRWREEPVPVERSAFTIGYMLLQAGRAADAEPYLRRAAADESDADARLQLGIALAETARHEEAIPELEEAVRLRPRDAVARYRLGVSYAGVGHYFAAVHALREAVRLDPRSPAARRALAAVSAVAGRAPTSPGDLRAVAS